MWAVSKAPENGASNPHFFIGPLLYYDHTTGTDPIFTSLCRFHSKTLTIQFSRGYVPTHGGAVGTGRASDLRFTGHRF